MLIGQQARNIQYFSSRKTDAVIADDQNNLARVDTAADADLAGMRMLQSIAQGLLYQAIEMQFQAFIQADIIFG